MDILLATKTINQIVFAVEVLIFTVAFLLIMVSLFRNKQDQSGLQALNGGNEELFLHRKERGLDKILSQIILILGISLLGLDVVAIILTNIYL